MVNLLFTINNCNCLSTYWPHSNPTTAIQFLFLGFWYLLPPDGKTCTRSRLTYSVVLSDRRHLNFVPFATNILVFLRMTNISIRYKDLRWRAQYPSVPLQRWFEKKITLSLKYKLVSQHKISLLLFVIMR